MKFKWVVLVALFCVVHVLVFTQVFPSGGPDMEVYYDYASQMKEGMLPYHDFNAEYPPGALLVFLVPRLMVDSFDSYGRAFTLEMLFFDLVGLFLILLLGRRLRLSPVSSLIIYTLSMLAIGYIMVQRYDVAPAVLTLGALYAFSRGNYKIAWALLALGTLVKLYPAVLAPVFLIYQWRHQRWRSLIAPLAVFMVIVLVVAVPFLRLDRQGFMESFTTQSQRALQLESSYSSVLLLGHTLGLTQAEPYMGKISYDVASSLAGPLARYSLWVMLLGMLLVYGLFFWSYRKLNNPRLSAPPDASDMAHVLNYSCLAILVTLLGSKVLSAQFIVWLYPLVPLIAGHWRHAVWLAFIVVGWLTRYIYPWNYWSLVNMKPVAIDVLVLRNALLLVMAIWLMGGRGVSRQAVAPSIELVVQPVEVKE